MTYWLLALCLVVPLQGQPTDILEESPRDSRESNLPSESHEVALAGQDALVGGQDATEPGANREEKFLSVFQIVKFQNGACPASDGNVGVCFTESECTGKAGVASGSCASGFGVCCVFTLSNCGDTISQNNTYLTSEQYPSPAPTGMCMYNLNKCDAGICQMRLEFEDVKVSNPAMGDCNNDTIMVSGVDSKSAKVVPMTLCGQLTGQHMIFDVKDQDAGAKLTFNIASSNPDTKWRIKVIQYACTDTDLLAPSGCLTYNTEPAGNIVSYNNQGGNGELINNQMFSHCIKEQDGFCDVTLMSNNFDLGPTDSLTFGNNVQTGSTFGTGGTLVWNFTGPYIATAFSDADNTNMNVGYDISYMLLPC